MEKVVLNGPVEALAEAWASIDGQLDAFRRERDNGVAPKDPAYTGHYDGYMTEAQEMIQRLERRGFTIVAALTPPQSEPQ